MSAQFPYSKQLGEVELNIAEMAHPPEQDKPFLATMDDDGPIGVGFHEAYMTREEAERLITEFEEEDPILMYENESVHLKYFPDFMP